jgi:hypothetical protein
MSKSDYQSPSLRRSGFVQEGETNSNSKFPNFLNEDVSNLGHFDLYSILLTYR